MASNPIYTALNVPTVTSNPSMGCLQWSADGQVCFTTKSALYIMTPDHGINFDTYSVIKSTVSRNNGEDGAVIGWFRTIIQLDKSIAYKWPDYSQEWAAASLGSIDVTLWSVTFSPSGVSPDSGCVLAVLSSNMDLTLWTAAKNCLKGEWTKTHDVTPFLLESNAAEEATEMTAKALEAQIVSITWSSQADFGLFPTPITDGSLLAAGNRAGSLVFLRYQGTSMVQHVHTLPVADKWITHLTFSSWVPVEMGTCETFLAYGTADGAVGLVKVTQTLHETPSVSPFGSNYDIHTTFEQGPESLHAPDKSAITALTWIEVSKTQRIVIHTKPGLVHLWSASSSETGWSGNRTLALKTQKLSTSASSFHPVSGIQYIQRRDVLVLTLFDGSYHVIHNLSHDPSWTSVLSRDTLTTESLSIAARSVFTEAEQGEIDRMDVNRTTGLISYDGSATFLWVHEVSRPMDFSYKHDAKHNTMIISARLWDDTDDNILLQELAQVLNFAKTVSGLAPLHLLRPFLFHLRDRVKLDHLLPRVLEILQPNFVDHSVHITISRYTGLLNSDMRVEFRSSLRKHLFGWDVLLLLRMRLSLADFAWKLSGDEKKQTECGHVAQHLLNTISHRVLRTIIRHIVAAVSTLTSSDVPFVFRMVVQSLLPGSPPDLTIEGQNLSASVRDIIPVDPESTSEANGLNEPCPACGVQVPLQDITTAVCSNGHTWARCSVTTFILSTPLVRTCVGCSRKAFLPLSTPHSTTTQNWLPLAARGWVVEELLEAVHRCLFCGNSFVSVL